MLLVKTILQTWRYAMSRRTKIFLFSILLGLTALSVVFAVMQMENSQMAKSPVKTSSYPQIKLFHHTPDCNWAPNSSLPEEFQDEKEGGGWFKVKDKLGGFAAKECKGPVTAVDKANAWLKKNGNTILILGYQYNGNIITILWQDKSNSFKRE